jgi:hypothetical protein
MWISMHASNIMDLTRDRALFLENFLGTISER